MTYDANIYLDRRRRGLCVWNSKDEHPARKDPRTGRPKVHCDEHARRYRDASQRQRTGLTLRAQIELLREAVAKLLDRPNYEPAPEHAEAFARAALARTGRGEEGRDA